jgi:hypothetical protein
VAVIAEAAASGVGKWAAVTTSMTVKKPGSGWQAELGNNCRQWGIDRAKGDFVFLIFLSPLFDKK